VRTPISALALGLVAWAPAGAADEPLLRELTERFQSKPLALGALVQVVGVHQTGDSTLVESGFALANFRASLRGELDGGWGYYLQASFTKAPAFLNASVRFAPSPAAGFELGAAKAPFSAEFLTSAASIDFVNRSQVVTALSPGRQVGAIASGAAGGFDWAVAAVNGNGLKIENDDGRLMAVARVRWSASSGEDGVAVGAGAYHSRDTDAPIGVPITGDFLAEGFGGERRAAGADVRVTRGPWMVSGEGIVSRFDPRGGARREPSGFHVTAGWRPSERTQLLARWDSFAGDGAVADSDLAIFGLNVWPTAPTEVQLNLVFPAQGNRDPQVLANVQVGF